MSSTTFLKQFVRNPTKVGAIVPSSSALVAAMVDSFDWDSARGVVEFGPGTGVFTSSVTKCLHGEAKFFAIEQSPSLVATTRARCPGVTVYQDCATNVADLCERESMPGVDAVICGLPWASFSTKLQTEIIDALFEVLVPGGQFATFAYLQGTLLPAGRRFSEFLDQRFSKVERSRTVWRNVPPAFVYRCVR